MSREARRISPTGIYHVMMRGINRQRIFEDAQDEQKYLELLRIYKKRCGFALYGYCLMGNHVHLLIREAAGPSVVSLGDTDVEVGPGESLENVFKRIGVSYVGYFNRRHKRTGHLFQDRFRSEVIDTDEYLLMALRYIHLNPVKAGICASPEDYPRSSYREYLRDGAGALTDREFILKLLSREQLRAFTAAENEDRFMDMERPSAVCTDAQAGEHLLKLSGCASPEDFRKLGKEDRQACIRKLRGEGCNIAQISRMTGYSRPVIYRALED